MISIDREMLWQWDYGQRVQLHDVPVGTAVHFSNAAIKPNALVTEAYEDGECVYANIPNILLQTAGTLTAYIYLEDGDEGHTEYRKMFIVRDREKPDDYVYTEDDVKTWVSLEERIKVLEESGGGAAGGLIRPLSTIGEIDGVKVEHVPDRDRVDLTVEMTADSMHSVFGGNAVYKNDFLNARQLQLMLRVPGMGKLFLWELFEDDLVTVTNYPNKKFIMVSTNRMIVSFTYDENGQFVSETKTYQANVQQLDEAKATIPNSATVNEDNELVMQRADGDAVSELFKVRLPQGGGSSDIPDTLPNPHPLTFTGAVEATYDGSTPVEVEIPMGGTGGGYKWELIEEITLSENVASVRIDLPLEYSAFSIVFRGTLVTETNTTLDMRFNNDINQRPQFSDLQYRQKRPTEIKIERRGTMYPIVTRAVNGGSAVVNEQKYVADIGWKAWNEFTYVTCYAQDNEFASGYEITVFGVRA